MSTAEAALRAAATAGPYFVWEPWTAGAGWRPLSDLTRPDVAAARVDAARDTLVAMSGLDPAAVPVRVVASVTFLGLASRLVSPPLAAVALTGTLPVARPDQLWWRPVAGGPWPVAYSGVSAPSSFTDAVVNGLVAPVLHTFQERFALSPRVLWGNVASALAGAAGMITDPAGAERAATVVGDLLALPPLAGTGRLVRPSLSHTRRFLIRDNCCLYYRLPNGGYCGDCVLTPDAERRRAWQAALHRD